MSHKRLKVLIIGAGAGGLCLAQGLKHAGIPVEVFERDISARQQRQGYRLSISATGGKALKACLPNTLFDKLIRSTAQPSTAVTFVDHRLNRLLAVDLPRYDRDSLDAERPVSRAVLRRILLEGLEDIVHFGKRFVAFDEAPEGGVAAHFADGSGAVGDLLVGADGANSQVRSLLLPGAKRKDTGLLGIGGKLALTDEVRAATPPAILRGPTPILGPRGSFMFASTVGYDDLNGPVGRADAAGSSGGSCDGTEEDREEYVMWGFTARREKLAVAKDAGALTGAELKNAVEAQTGDWHAALRRLIAWTDPVNVKAFSVKTSVPVAPWRTRNVTLLGDALHNMPPFRGAGANTALWDAAKLRDALIAVDQGERDLLEALADYERVMIDHGFRAVRTSLRDMARFHAEGFIARSITRAFFRTLDRVPALRTLVVQGR
jgi:2-polyprenyl-6-methoxyphenol hydroxylase-like FAD-dependent oxidoreductase